MMRMALAGGALLTLVLSTGCSSTPPRPTSDTLAARAAEHALRMQGKPYRYGGSTPQGFDCSGLVHYSFGRVGVQLPRSTEGLWQQSRSISPGKLQPGDLLFFDQEGKRSSHVAIYLGNDQFVHAPSIGKKVNVASFNDAYWRRHFAGARRVQSD